MARRDNDGKYFESFQTDNSIYIENSYPYNIEDVYNEDEYDDDDEYDEDEYDADYRY